MQQLTGALRSRRRVALVALVAVMAVMAVMVVWGSTFVVTKAAMRQFPPFTLAFLRFAIATIVLVPLLRGGALMELRRSVSAVRLFIPRVHGDRCIHGCV